MTIPKPTDLALHHLQTQLDDQASAETQAGLGIPIEDVEAWIETWDTPNEASPPTARKVR